MAHSHKRDTNARHFPRIHLLAGPLAFVATATAVGLGVLATAPEARDGLVASTSTSISDVRERREPVSRSQSRTEGIRLQEAPDPLTDRTATLRAIRNADTRLWTTVDLNLWTTPYPKAEKVGLVEGRERVLVTGRKTRERVEVVLDGKARWVTAGYLVEEKPERPDKPEQAEAEAEAEATDSADVSASCTNGSSVPSGVSPNVVAVHEAVCANFPEITSYGTFRSDGEHGQGLAIDIMVSGERGWQVAEFVRSNYSELGVSYIIYAQNIWSVERGGEGWRGMEDRGSTTANHFDHVHVTTY